MKSEVTAGGLDRLMATPAAVADGSISLDAAAPAGDTNAQNRANTLASRFDAEAYWAGDNGKGGGAPQYHSMDTPRGRGKGRGRVYFWLSHIATLACAGKCVALTL